MNKTTTVATVMRVVLGILFLAHGVDKLQTGLGNVADWFSSIGVPGFLAYFVAGLELVGGAMLIIGLLTRYIAALFVIMLVGAIFTAKLSAGLLGNGQMAGYELDLAFMIAAVYLVVAEPTHLSVDHMLSGKRSA